MAILNQLKKCKSGETLVFDFPQRKQAKARAGSLQALAKRKSPIVKRALERTEEQAGKKVYRVYVTRS